MRCLSRMSGNLQVRFLGGRAVATSPGYPTGPKAVVARRDPAGVLRRVVASRL